jgi:hypothetical protein
VLTFEQGTRLRPVLFKSCNGPQLSLFLVTNTIDNEDSYRGLQGSWRRSSSQMQALEGHKYTQIRTSLDHLYVSASLATIPGAPHPTSTYRLKRHTYPRLHLSFDQ